MSGEPNKFELKAIRQAYASEIEELKAEIDYLRKALSFYAVRANWDPPSELNPWKENCLGDRGAIARWVLKGERDGG